MTTRRGIAPRRFGVRVESVATRAEMRALTAQETAWLLLAPALAVSVLTLLLLGKPLGRLAFTGTHYTYWPSAAGPKLFPKPAQLARFTLAIACAAGYAAAIPLAARRAPHADARRVRAAVTSVQLLTVLGLVVFWIAQSHVNRYEIKDPDYFTTPTTVVACVLAALGAVALARRAGLAPLRPIRLGARAGAACALAAALLTALWLLPSIFTDQNILLAHESVLGHLQFSFDESMSVLDGRSPLVNMATYGALVPYLIALPLAALGATLLAFTTLMTTLSALALLAVYALLRRLARNPLAALALYAPVLATSLFIVRGTAVERFDYGNYFGMFPIRYGGPYLLAWLTTRHLDGDRPRSAIPLFAFAGLVALNNTDFGLPALAATAVALTAARPPRGRADLGSLLRQVGVGAGIALALVSLLTLLRAGTLPHLGRLFAFARLFGVAGYGNLPTPVLGFHLAILATFAAALASAAVRAVHDEGDAPLTGMLAWCGVFGLGTGTYFAYRSHPDTLIASFSIWSLTLALLLIAAVRARLRHGPARPSPATLALLVGCGLAVCSLAQLPLPWLQVERISQSTGHRPLAWPTAARFIRHFVRPGDAVAILTPLGHRLGYELGIRNVEIYTGMLQMPTKNQLEETIAALRAEGGDMLFLGEQWWAEVEPALRAAGFRRIEQDPVSGFVAWRDVRGP